MSIKSVLQLSKQIGLSYIKLIKENPLKMIEEFPNIKRFKLLKELKNLETLSNRTGKSLSYLIRYLINRAIEKE